MITKLYPYQIIKLFPWSEWSPNYHSPSKVSILSALSEWLSSCLPFQSPLQKWSSSCTPCPSVHQIEPILKLLPLPEWSSCCPPCQSDQISSNSNDCQIGPLVKVIIKLSSGSEYPSNFTPFQWFPNWRYQFDSVPRARMITKLTPLSEWSQICTHIQLTVKSASLTKWSCSPLCQNDYKM